MLASEPSAYIKIACCFIGVFFAPLFLLVRNYPSYNMCFNKRKPPTFVGGLLYKDFSNVYIIQEVPELPARVHPQIAKSIPCALGGASYLILCAVQVYSIGSAISATYLPQKWQKVPGIPKRYPPPNARVLLWRSAWHE